jgi:hypothetical protein
VSWVKKAEFGVGAIDAFRQSMQSSIHGIVIMIFGEENGLSIY